MGDGTNFIVRKALLMTEIKLIPILPLKRLISLIYKELKTMTFAPVSLNILGIKINAIDHASIVNLGSSQHLDQFVSYKRNQGIGEQNGDSSPNILSSSWVLDPGYL